MAYNQTKKGVEAALDRFTQLMVERMEQMKGQHWQKPWLDCNSVGIPQNVSGRAYSGSNSFFLMLHGAKSMYDKPCYMTFKQAQDMGCHIKAGEKSFPVVYWDFTIIDKNGHKVPRDKYNGMSHEEKKELKTIPFLKYFHVFNVDQTSLREDKPDKYAAICEKFKPVQLRDEIGMFVHDGIDRMVESQQWVCPIYQTNQSKAFFSPSADRIHVPNKTLFNKGGSEEDVFQAGMEYYSMLLHEMAHSTGHESRLNRLEGGRFGDPKYAKEELVAELTSAMIGSSLGFASKIADNSACYLDNWIQVLKEEPKFIVSLMSDVNKASEMIFDHIDSQQIKLGKEPYLMKNNALGEISEDGIECPFRGTSIVKNPDGSFELRSKYNGVELDSKTITKADADIFLRLDDKREHNVFTSSLLKSTYSDEIKQIDKGYAQQNSAGVKW